MNKTVFCLTLTLLLAGTIFLACDIKPARSDYVWTETIYINADGSINPLTAPISSGDNVTYTLTDNIVGNVPNGSSAINIQRNNTIIDGAGHRLQGTNVSESWGINLSESNVTIKNMKITEFYYGIYLGSSSNNSVSGNNITANTYGGIGLYSSSNNNSVSGNNITANNYGILQGSSSSNNNFSGNNITANSYGIWLWHSFDSSINRNIIANNGLGIGLDSRSSNDSVSGNSIRANNGTGVQLSANCSNDNVSGNDITANGDNGVLLSSSDNSGVSGNNITANNGNGIELDSSSNNTIYHNNIMNNTSQAYISNSTNTWDNGYPSGGNYWSDYSGVDVALGPNQNITGSDQIGDTAYVINFPNNIDHYPLMGSFGSSTPGGLNVTVFPSDDVGLTFQNVTVEGSTRVNEMQTYAPALSNLTGEYYDVRVSASYTGNITVRLIFDGSNITQDQKSRLQLMQFTALTGDIAGPSGIPDGKVDIRDISLIAKAFGSSPGQPSWNPICDLNGDGKIDIRDISLAAKNVGLTSSWVNITTSIDTTNNVIYGVTTHFSIIGIHQS